MDFAEKNVSKQESNSKQSWKESKTNYPPKYKSKSDEDVFMTFQSKEPIVSIDMQEKNSTEKKPGSDEAHGGHGIPVEHPTSFLETLMHLFKGNIGSGVFAMGNGIRNAGIIFGPIVVVALGIICVHCQHALLSIATKIKAKYGITPDFAQTVELCFESGPPAAKKLSKIMKRIVNTFLCITQVGFCCVYIVFISENIKQVMDYYGYKLDVHLHMVIILLPILLTSLVRNLKYLAPFSVIANGFMLVGLAVTIYYTTQNVPSLSELKYIASLSQLPLFFGTAIYSFEGIGLVLPLQNEMKKPAQFKKPMGVLNIGMAVVISTYTLVGCLGYAKYGEGVKGSVTLNLPEDEILAQTVKIIISLSVLMGYALQLYVAIEIMWPNVHKLLGPVKYPVLAELSFRSLIVLLTFVLAEAIPFLELFISLIGAVSSSTLALMFPPVLDIVSKHTYGELGTISIVKNVIIILFGVVGCFTGTYESINAIVKAFKNGEAS